MTRIYNQWAGNPKGIPEDTTRCIAEVWDGFLSYQCSRKRGYGPNGEYCKQHAKIKERSERVRKKLKNNWSLKATAESEGIKYPSELKWPPSPSCSKSKTSEVS